MTLSDCESTDDGSMPGVNVTSTVVAGETRVLDYEPPDEQQFVGRAQLEAYISPMEPGT